MPAYDFDLPALCAYPPLFSRLVEGTETLARLDEMARKASVAEGWGSRLLYRQTVGGMVADNQLVHLDDVVLYDSRVWHGGPRADLSQAMHTLRIWRRAWGEDAGGLLRSPLPGELVALDHIGQEHPEDFGVDTEEGLRSWRATLAETAKAPALLAAALAWDAWLSLENAAPWRATLVAALVLKARGLTGSFLLPVDWGRQFASYRRDMRQSQGARLAGFMDWAVSAAGQARKELMTLEATGGRLRLLLKGRRRNSRLPRLIDLFLAKPLVSASMAAAELGCSQTAIRQMLPVLGSRIREMTDQRRYRMWAI